MCARILYDALARMSHFQHEIAQTTNKYIFGVRRRNARQLDSHTWRTQAHMLEHVYIHFSIQQKRSSLHRTRYLHHRSKDTGLTINSQPSIRNIFFLSLCSRSRSRSIQFLVCTYLVSMRANKWFSTSMPNSCGFLFWSVCFRSKWLAAHIWMYALTIEIQNDFALFDLTMPP